ncbi:MAG: PilW family protein [Cocleimonas sp.]|nr:PilW family protein [Cocleimonas sp.]
MKTPQFTKHQKTSLELQFQRGLSLVELLIAMVIGIFLVGGLITNFVSTKGSDKMRNISSEMDSSAQTAMNILRQAITHAAYPSINNIELEKSFVTKKDFPNGSSDNTRIENPNCSDGVARDITRPRYKFRTRDGGGSGGNGIRDLLTIVSLADNPLDPDALVYYDCTGGGMTRNAHDVACSTDNMPNKREAKIFSTFRVKNTAGTPTLYCDGSRGGGQPIADNVYAIQYLYGVTKDPQDKDIAKTIYKGANAIDDADEWGLVNSVQIALLMQSAEENATTQASESQYRLLNRNINIPSGGRHRLYRVYTTTVNLENMNKAPLL